VLTIAALLSRRRIAQALAGGLVAITFLDLFVFGAGYNASLDRDDLYPETPGIEFLRSDADLFRIAPVGAWLDPFPGYTSNIFALDTIGGYDHFRDEDYQRFIDPMQSPADNANYEGPAYVTIGSDRWPLNENLLALLNVKYIATPPNGLFYGVVGESRVNTAVGVYDDVTQGQAFASGGEQIDAFEFLLGTGGTLSGPDTPVTFELKGSPRDREAIHTWVVDGRSIRDNQWFRIDLPDDVDTTDHERLTIEISAPRLPKEQALFVWSATSEELAGGQRFESGEETTGTITFRALRLPGSWVTPEYEGDDLVVYRLTDALPRAWGVGAAEVLPGRDAVLERVASETFDPGRAVVFEADDVGPDEPGEGQRGDFASEITDYEPDSMAVRTDFSDDGYLVVSIPHDDAWQATVDGEDADILPANGLLQAVPVDAGVHEVELEFRPAEYVWGQRISIVTLVTLLVGGMAYVGYSQRRRLRPTRDDQESS
jgi:hypothetical protein